MKTLVDVHNHLSLLPSFINQFNTRIYKHQNSPDFLLKKAQERDLKIIISVALYLSPTLGNPLAALKKQIEKVYEFVANKPEVKLIMNANDLDANFRMGLILHLESASWLKGDLNLLSQLHNLGVRGIIPVHFISSWFGGSGEDPRPSKGLTEKGKIFLDNMDKLHMWLDISHMDETTTTEALNYYSGNIIASHVGLKEFCPPKRNISIENAKLLFKKGGHYGLIAWSHLMGKSQDDFMKQIDYLLAQDFSHNLVLGTDFGAPIKTPNFLKSIFDYADFIENKYPEIAPKILGENAINFFKKSLPY